jgi:hypothetical protein
VPGAWRLALGDSGPVSDRRPARRADNLLECRTAPADNIIEKVRVDPRLAEKEPPMPITLAVLISLMLTLYGLAFALLVQGQRQDEWEERQARAFLEDEF